jgi:hypothetical protein
MSVPPFSAEKSSIAHSVLSDNGRRGRGSP